MTRAEGANSRFLPRQQLQELVDTLAEEGYEVIGPTVDQSAIVYRSIRKVDELPLGWSDQQEPGAYRVYQDDHDQYFRFNAGPDSWKKYLFPARHEIGRATLDDEGWHFEQVDADGPKYAFLGVRACDLAAISIQDRVFARGDYIDPAYRKRRDAAFIVAVNCSTAAPTCFCSSMNTGPCCTSGFDLSMSEIDDGFVIETGSDKGEKLLRRLRTVETTEERRNQAEDGIKQTEAAITKRFDVKDVYDLLMENLEHGQWDDVAQRCLSCANCTMVCPTCFCSTVDEVSDLRNENVTRVRSWDTCFNADLSYTAGGTVRDSIRTRYRQWLTHKLATWQDQFDVSGCTGCGRCITWCPVGIDLTEEVAAIRADVEATDS